MGSRDRTQAFSPTDPLPDRPISVFVLFYFLFLCMCVYVSVIHASVGAQMPEDSIGYLGAGVTGSCESPDVGTGD